MYATVPNASTRDILFVVSLHSRPPIMAMPRSLGVAELLDALGTQVCPICRQAHGHMHKYMPVLIRPRSTLESYYTTSAW